MTGAGGTRQLLYDGDALAAEYDGQGNQLTRYLHGAGEDKPEIWFDGATIGDAHYQYTDHQGSVVGLLTGDVRAMPVNTYDEYGIPGAGNIGRFGYTGQAWLPELGMWYYKARVYSPTLGRFLQTDPVGYTDQMDLYAYVANDPVNKTDPKGTETCEGLGCDKIHDYVVQMQKVTAQSDPAKAPSLPREASELGKPGEGQHFVADPKEKTGASFHPDDKAIHINPDAVANVKIGGGIVAHEMSHRDDDADHGPLKTGAERMQGEEKAYGVQNEYSRAAGSFVVDPKAMAQKSFDAACAGSSSPSCK